MRSILNKLLLVLVILAGWVTYDNWGKISSYSPTSVKNAVVNSFSFATSGSRKSKVYQWQDDKGQVHVSNTLPDNARNVKVVEYENDLNVVPGHKPAPEDKNLNTAPGRNTTGGDTPNSTRSNNQSNTNNNDLVDTYTSAIKDAKDVQKIMNKRNQNLQEQLK